MSCIISVINNKGGVGKTSSVANLAHALSNAKKTVCVVDMDSQCNLTRFYKLDNQKSSLYEILEKEDVAVENCLYATEYERVKCLPNVEQTAALEYDLVQNREEPLRILRKKIRDYCLSKFDFTILDSPPNLGFFSLSAMIASDFVVVPIIAGSAYSIDGLVRTINLIKDVQSTQNPELRFLKLLINQLDKRTTMGRICLEQIASTFPQEHVFKTSISHSTLFLQAEHLQTTVIRNSPNSAGAYCYRDLAKELIETTADIAATKAA